MSKTDLHQLERELLHHLEKTNLLKRDSRLLLAVSGGLDSTVMLYLFRKIQPFFNFALHLGHVNHQLRGDESDGDAKFVITLAEKFDLPYFISKVNVKSCIENSNLSLEEAARKLRYEALEKILSENGCTYLLTGHTANDQAETVLFRLFRGAGTKGLSGIPLKRDRIVRPMLIFKRRQLEEHAQLHKIDFRQDSSNKDVRFTRNRIRKELLPYLSKHFNPAIIQTLNRSADIFLEAENYLKSETAIAFKSLVSLQKKNEIILDIEAFLNYNRLIQKRVMQLCCELISNGDYVLDFEKLPRLLELIESKQVGKSFTVSKRLQILIDHDGLIFSGKEDTIPPRVQLDLIKNKSIAYANYRFEWAILESNQPVRFTRDNDVEFFDLDKTGIRLSLRSCKNGDKFVPLHLKGHKKVNDFYSDRKVPIRKRPLIPLLDSSDKVVWVCGYQIDDRFKVTKQSTRVLRMQMTTSDEQRGNT